MANYAHTKDIIAQNIYTNHEGRVTAEMVKTAANEIVNTLIAGGYLYAGVAKLTPTQTNPGSPDANVFYIATEPGTYTNFVGADGSLVVAKGEVAIFKFNGTWSKEVTGAATAAQVNQLGQISSMVFSKSGSTTRYVDINRPINSGDILFVRVTDWTGTEVEKGFLASGYLQGGGRETIGTVFSIGQDIILKPTNNYTGLRIASQAAVQESNVSISCIFANLSSTDIVAEIAKNRLNIDYHGTPLNVGDLGFNIKKGNSLSFGDVVNVANDFERGSISQSGSYSDDSKICRSRVFYPLEKAVAISFNISTDYLMGVRFFSSDLETVVRYSSAASENTINLSGNERFFKLIIKRANDTSLTPSEVAQLSLGIKFIGAVESKQNELHATILRDFRLEDSYIVNGLLDADGSVVANENHKTTDFIFVKAGDKFDYSLIASRKVIVVYNTAREVVDTVGVGGIHNLNEGTYTVSNDGYIRITNRVDSYPDGYVLFKKLLPGIVQKEIDAINDKFTDEIQPYFTSEMSDTIRDVQALQTEPCITFPIITDIHYRFPDTNPEQFEHSIENIRYFLNNVKCDFVLNLGDSSDGRAPLATQIEYSNHQERRFASLRIPYYMVQGNHELNTYKSATYDGSDKLTNEQIYNLFFSNTPLDVVRNPNCSMDYYVDFPLGVRMIVLDFSNQSSYKIADNTVSWFRDTALDSGKTILLASHYSPIADHNSYPDVYTDANFATVVSIINSFISGGGTIINICGHSHADFKFTAPWLQVSLNNARPIQSDISIEAYDYLRANTDIVSPARQYGTVTEDCWTVCVLRPLSRKIDFIRFGAGSDRKNLMY